MAQAPQAAGARQAAGQGYISPAREGRTFQAMGSPIRLKAAGADTGGALELFESEFPPGLHLPPHYHRTYDEAFYVLEGEVFATVGDRTAAAPAGSFGYAPRGTVHTFENRGTAPARVVVWQTPAYGFDRLAQELSALPPGPPDMARLGPILQRYDVNPVGPPPGQAGR